MQDESYEGRLTVTVARTNGLLVSRSAVGDVYSARLFVLENGVPWNMRICDAVRVADRVMLGEHVEVGGLVLAVTRDV